MLINSFAEKSWVKERLPHCWVYSDDFHWGRNVELRNCYKKKKRHVYTGVRTPKGEGGQAGWVCFGDG